MTRKWHPKLTPYRFFVLLSTIGLGTGKAFANAQSLSLVATNIEWITGVIIFLIIYVLGLFENNPPRSGFLSWFLVSDILQSYLGTSHSPQHDPSGPFVNGYRLLTTLSVTLFGVVKAYFSYQDNSPAANAVDWILGVIIASSLYILGLYEDNPMNLMPYLFSTDCSSFVYASPRIVIYLTGVSLSFLWMKITSKIMFILLFEADLHAVYHQVDPVSHRSHLGLDSSGNLPLPKTLALGLSNLSAHCLKTSFTVLGFMAGFLVFCITLHNFLHSVIHGLSFIRISPRTSSATPTHFHLGTPLLWFRNIFESEIFGFVFGIFGFTLCLIIPATLAIFFLSLSYLSLDFSFSYFDYTGSIQLTLLWYMANYLTFAMTFGIALLAFLGFVACLSYMVYISFELFRSLIVLQEPMSFDPFTES